MTSDGDRLRREATFHDRRNSGVERIAQDRFYAAIEAGNSKYCHLVDTFSSSADVLEYGCGIGTESLRISKFARFIHGIDISPVSIDKARLAAREQGIRNLRFSVMNCEEMDLPDNSIDFVFGSGIIHHVDVQRSISEVKRVLRSNGRAVFFEPLGHNPLINLYRRMTPDARTADEHPLTRGNLHFANSTFPESSFEFYGLATLAGTLLRDNPWRIHLERLDRFLLGRTPLRWQAWFVLMQFQKSP